jgi:nitric oxide reductase NorD protein
LDVFRLMALQQAARAHRGSVALLGRLGPLEQSVYAVIEAQAADCTLTRMLPGLSPSLKAFRAHALQDRPAPGSMPAARRPLEAFVREQLAEDVGALVSTDPEASATLARALARALLEKSPEHRPSPLLFKDLWTGSLLPATGLSAASAFEPGTAETPTEHAPRSARLARSPRVREAGDEEDDRKPGPWMVPTAQPHEQVEDPLGAQRPTDRDKSTAAEDFADALSELPEARLVSTPGRPKEILLSGNPVAARPRNAAPRPSREESVLGYPEWDCRTQAYVQDAVAVHSGIAEEGPQEWVDRTLARNLSMANLVRRRFEMLKAQRVRLRKQLEGDDLDLDACTEALGDYRAGLPMSQSVYQTYRVARRDMAILLLVDISGSTDSWVSEHRRVIDVEKEALLFVSIALQGMAEPHAVLAFSGEGPRGVVVRSVKHFDEANGAVVARRIAALEPQAYTRSGAAIRHATSLLMKQPVRHRLLLMLSDGKPNDVDDYGSRYGIEDMRQAVTEARLQGVTPFCLTVDRQAADYLPGIFGSTGYALLPRPAILPAVLLDWMSRLFRA